MANVENNNRIAEFVKKHVYAKRWVSIMLVIALLVTTVTMYALNKSATAVSENSAEDVGMVLDAADSEAGDSTGTDIETEDAGDSTENESEESASEDATAVADNSEETTDNAADASDSENKENTDNAEQSEATSENADAENTDSDDSENAVSSDSENVENSDAENTENNDSNDSSSEENNDSEETNGDDTEKTTDSEETADNTDPEEESTEVTDPEAVAASDSKEKTDEEETEEEVKEEESETDTELTQDVILTVSYKNEDGESIADDKEINLTDSIDFTESAPEQEGYIFKSAKIDETVITKITVKYDDNNFKFYEVTLEDASTEEVKEDKTVVLTYAKEVSEKTEIKLTAKYADKNGESIKDDAELNIASELDVTKKENVDQIDNYFYMSASYNDQKIAKIAPVVTENTDAETAEQTEEANENNADSVEVSSYIITTLDGTEISVEEDAEIVFTYYKAIDTTEFTSTNDKVTVTATLSAPGAFPEGTELKVTEVTTETTGYNYDAYMQALNDNADKIAEAKNADAEADAESTEEVTYDENNTILYDVAFMLEGVEYQPKQGEVNVKIEFNDKQLTENLAAATEDDIAVVHLPIKEEVKEASEINSTEEATEIKADDIEVKTLTDATAEVEKAEAVEFKEEGFSIFAVMKYQKHDKGTDTFETVLGDAVNFGLVANFLQIVNDGQTNIAVKKIRTVQQTGNDLTNPEEQTMIIGEVESGSHLKIKGNSGYVFIPKVENNNQRDQYTYDHVQNTTNDTVKIDTTHTYTELTGIVSDMLKYVRDASADLSGRPATVKIETVDGKPGIDITGEKDGTYYLHITDDNQDFLNAIKNSDGFVIKKKSGQTIVFNISSKSNQNNEFWLNKPVIYNDGVQINVGQTTDQKPTGNGTDDGEKVSRTLIWNFINAKEVFTKDSFLGVCISGQTSAKFTADATAAGWVAFPDVILNSGEWHNTYDNIKKLGGKADLQAYKYVNDNPSYAKGFKFTLYKSNGVHGNKLKWTELQTVENDEETPQNVVFDSIQYLWKDETSTESNVIVQNTEFTSETAAGKSETYYYKIVESKGNVDKDGNRYTADKTEYYAVVTVTVKEEKSVSDHKVKFLSVSTPEYYKTVNITGNGKNISFADKVEGIPTFNNKVGQLGDLRIHKMVVNDYGSDFVRDSQYSILNNVVFRITNNATHNYIVLKGFTGHAGDSAIAKEYDVDGNEINEYTYYYNQSAQWTIKDIPAGEYTVEEVADGYTFTYEPKSNRSTIKDDQPISRITMYEVTVDSDNGLKTFGYGGQNLRQVFAVDCNGKSYIAPKNVVVGSELENDSNTQTVQVCNFYSNPIGPIQITKNFSGGEWTEDMEFTFTIQEDGFTPQTSEGDPIPTNKQPMPTKVTRYQDGVDSKGNPIYKYTAPEEVRSVTVKGGEGVSSRIVDFGYIPFRFKGVYKYKITESKENKITGVKYDDSVYYVEVTVSEKSTTFTKKYKYSDLSNPKYTGANDGDYLKVTEDFKYLGADIVYKDANSQVLAKCSVTLDGVEPDTNDYSNNKFKVEYSIGSVATVAFNNYYTSQIILEKIWTKGGTNVTNEEHSPISVVLHKVTKDGNETTDTEVGTYELSANTKEDNDRPWTRKIEIPRDGSEYYIEEINSPALIVTYSNSDGSTTSTNPADVKVKDDGSGVLSLIVSNELGDNVLPSTGGSGTVPFAVGGLGISMIGLLGYEMSRRKKKY